MSDYYQFSTDEGLVLGLAEDSKAAHESSHNILISTKLLLALHDIQNMQESQWKELRQFLDKVFSA